MACTKGACSASSTASFAAVTSSAERSSVESADTPLKSDSAPEEAFAGIFPLSCQGGVGGEGGQRAGARGEAREERRASELGGTTSVGPHREIGSRYAAFGRSGPSDPEPTRRAGGRERTPEETHRCSRVMDMACVRVRLRSLAFDRDSPPVARACVAPHDRNALKRVDAAASGQAPLNPIRMPLRANFLCSGSARRKGVFE